MFCELQLSNEMLLSNVLTFKVVVLRKSRDRTEDLPVLNVPDALPTELISPDLQQLVKKSYHESVFFSYFLISFPNFLYIHQIHEKKMDARNNIVSYSYSLLLTIIIKIYGIGD